MIVLFYTLAMISKINIVAKCAVVCFLFQITNVKKSRARDRLVSMRRRNCYCWRVRRIRSVRNAVCFDVLLGAVGFFHCHDSPQQIEFLRGYWSDLRNANGRIQTVRNSKHYL